MKTHKKILIVGGTGFIGYHLAKEAISRKWRVTSISLTKPKKKRFLNKVKYVLCDITNYKKLSKKIKNDYDFVINFGGHVDHKNKKKTYRSHYLGCKNLIKFFLKNEIKSFIQIGTGGEYGNLNSPHKENLFFKPKSGYAYAKFLASQYSLKMHKKKNFPSTIIRLYQVYGSLQDTNRFLPVLITNCINNKSFSTSNGQQYRDFIHVKDVTNAIFKCFNSEKCRGKIINIGFGTPIKIKDIILKVKKYCKGGKPIFGKIKLRKDENFKTYPNISRAKSLLKWKPKISFRKGLLSTIQSYYENK